MSENKYLICKAHAHCDGIGVTGEKCRHRRRHVDGLGCGIRCSKCGVRCRPIKKRTERQAMKLTAWVVWGWYDIKWIPQEIHQSKRRATICLRGYRKHCGKRKWKLVKMQEAGK